MELLLSIGITSYNRIQELKRCINSIKTKYADEIEVIVSEDCSPMSEQISKMVTALKQSCHCLLRYMPNERNLGYDGNLGAIIRKSQGKYVLLMSDDDTLYDGFLDILIPFLKNEENDYGVFYSPFVYSSDKKMDRNYGKDMILDKGENSCSKHLYDSILFSGLVFKKSYVEKYDAGRFLNMNYFQVYLFLKMIFHHGGYYFSQPSVWCVGDGENAYGLSESSGGNNVLANRQNVLSILEFNKTLFEVIRLFDKEEGTNIFASFEKQYSLHSYSPLSIARKSGKMFFNEYWKTLNSLDIKLYPIVHIYYFMLLFLGSNLSNKLTSLARKLLKNEKTV